MILIDEELFELDGRVRAESAESIIIALPQHSDQSLRVTTQLSGDLDPLVDEGVRDRTARLDLDPTDWQPPAFAPGQAEVFEEIDARIELRADRPMRLDREPVGVWDGAELRRVQLALVGDDPSPPVTYSEVDRIGEGAALGPRSCCT